MNCFCSPCVLTQSLTHELERNTIVYLYHHGSGADRTYSHCCIIPASFGGINAVEVSSGQECNKAHQSDSARGARLCACSSLAFSHTTVHHMHCTALVRGVS